MRRRSIAVIILALLLASTVNPVGAAETKCPPSSTDGETIGKIRVGDVNVNLKAVTYPKGGTLLPPRSPLNAGLSSRHMPLDSQLGTSLITWHVNFNGCQGRLNVINNKPIGFEFSVTDQDGNRTKYKVTERVTVKKGNYKEEWFDLSGPRKLLLVTCIGKVVNGSYQSNLVIMAEPV